MSSFFKTLVVFFEKLSSKPRVGGLQITDSALQYALIDNKTIKNFALRLPLGVISQGKVKDAEQFSKILRNLHELIAPQQPALVLKVMVVLPTEVVYTQSFGVPNINQEKLEEATRLNLQMISPIAAPEAYMSSQVIEETQDRYELLGAFAEKSLIENYRTLLLGVGFEPLIFEFPALALSRIVSQAVGTAKESMLVLQISGDGLDIFIFRNDSLHFDYFRSWQSIQGEAREISKAVFEEVVLEEVQKVINFALSRFREVPHEALLITPGMETEIKTILEQKFGLKAIPLVISAYSLNSNWYAVLGAAIRGNVYPKDDAYIALGVAGTLSVFYEERILNFIRLWRNILAGVLGLFLVVYGISAAYLVGEKKSLNAQLANISIQAATSKELQAYTAQAAEFNSLVQSIAQTRGQTKPWVLTLKQLTNLASANHVDINQLVISSISEPIRISAHAPDHDTVLNFKNIISNQTNITNVDLPLSTITTQPDNSVSFDLTFKLNNL